MESNRSYRAKNNMAFGIANKLLNCVLPFASRTAVLYILGSRYLGLGTLFTSILSFLSLTELGLSSAINYAMYEPIAHNEFDKVSALLAYYKRLYRLIGIIILVIGLIIIPLMPYLISGEVPNDINIFFLYCIYLVSAVLSYFFGGYRQCILTASQREDIVSKVGIAVLAFNNIGQILALILTKNYYVFSIVPLVGVILTNTVCAILSKRMYPEIRSEGKIDAATRVKIRKKIGGLFGTKLNSVVIHQADTLVISAFLGLEILAAYGNYYYIMNAVGSFVIVIFTSLTASVGNKLVLDDIESSYNLFKRISFINAWIVSFCCTCFICLYQPFMKLWVGDDLMLPMPLVVLLTMYFFVYQIQRTIVTFKDAAGLWYEDRFRPYLSMILNVVANIIMVQYWGLYGIVISTILAFLISVPWMNFVLHKCLFKQSSINNCLVIGKWACITAFTSVITYYACVFLPWGIAGIIIRLIVCLISPNIIIIGIFFKSDEFKFTKNLIFNLLKRGK